jgi:hemolysin D
MTQGDNDISILIVDHNSETRASLKTFLAPEPDFTVVASVSNGHESVEQTKVLHPDVIIMDVDMPKLDGIDGFDATNLILKDDPESLIIASSVNDTSEAMTKAFLTGVRFVLHKPLDLKQVRSVIRAVYEQPGPIIRYSN